MKLKKFSDDHEKKLWKSTDLLRHYEYAFVRLSTSDMYWNLYKDLDGSSDAQTEALYNQSIKCAVHFSKRAFDYADENLKNIEYEHLQGKYQDLVNATRCNYAYHLATRGEPKDKTEALKISEPLFELSKKEKKAGYSKWYDLKEAYAWVRYLNGNKKFKTEAESIAKELLEDPTIPEEWREEYKKRYRKKGLDI